MHHPFGACPLPRHSCRGPGPLVQAHWLRPSGPGGCNQNLLPKHPGLCLLSRPPGQGSLASGQSLLAQALWPKLSGPLALGLWPRSPGPDPMAQNSWSYHLAPALYLRPSGTKIGWTARQMDGWANGCRDVQTDKISPAFYRTLPLLGPLPCKKRLAGQGYR